MTMNNKQRKTLKAVFTIPTPSDLKYQVIHKPHPQSEIKQYAVRIIKEFLISTGVKP